MSTSPFKDVLNTPLNKLVGKRKITCVEPTHTLGMVTVTLNSQKIASAPIMQGPKFLGFVSMMDIVAYAVQSRLFDFNGEGFAKGKADIEHKTIVPNLTSCKKTESAMRNDGNPLYEAIEIFATGSTHRLALLGANFAVVNIVSQSDVAKFLHGVMKQAGPNSPQTLACKAQPIKSTGKLSVVKESTILDAAFAQMIDDGVSTLAVVDKNGKLIGNLSPSDYVSVNFANIDCMKLPVKDFLTKFSPKSLKPITIPESGSLFAALDAIVSNHVHGLWVVDKDGKPTNKISLTDVMRTVRDLKVAAPGAPKTMGLPGTLTVELAGTAGLPKPATRATITVVGARVIVKQTNEVKASQAPDVRGRFSFELEAKDSDANVVITFYNKNDEVSKRTFPMPWILAGFGSGNPQQRQTEDVFAMDGGVGSVNLVMTFASK